MIISWPVITTINIRSKIKPTVFVQRTTEGLIVEPVLDDARVVVSLAEQVLGRVPLEDVKSGKTIVAKAGEMIDEAIADAIGKSGIKLMKTRSVLTCKAKDGVCVKCYGRDLSNGDIVGIGEAIGVIAAQSIGEPGTQLTMRTFHIGGAAQRGTDQSSISAISDAVVKLLVVTLKSLCLIQLTKLKFIAINCLMVQQSCIRAVL